MPEFILFSPRKLENERIYIYQLILKQWLGFDCCIEFWDKPYIKIIKKHDSCSLYVADCFFSIAANNWLQQASLPSRPLETWEIANNLLSTIPLTDKKLPVLFGNKKLADGEDIFGDKIQPFLWRNTSSLFLGLDVFGAAFFMLTRYEEHVKQERDCFNRFSAQASVAYQEGFINRPIINEYIEILWWCINYLWPTVKRKPRAFKIIATHDVDRPFAQVFSGFMQLVRNFAGDLNSRHNPSLLIARLKSIKKIKNGDYKADINYTFDLIMDYSEKYNIRSSFYFIAENKNPQIDANYDLEHPIIKRLMLDIHQRGHEIGLHTSFESYNDQLQIKKEFDKLLSTCEKQGITQDIWGGRQHYLRWAAPFSWKYWQEAGLNYDSTLIFPEYCGFRCGVCYEYPVYDLLESKQLAFSERPLLIMDVSLLEKQYMGLDFTDAIRIIKRYKEYCYMFNGDFIFLWHNNNLFDQSRLALYEELLKI